MKGLRLAIAAAGAVALVSGAAVAWIVFGPGALDFAGGPKVELADYHDKSPTGVPAALASTDLVARGEYLTHAADCGACHTAKGGKPFAGGMAFKLPIGTIYAPNLTPDPETGIGAWSDAEFIRALHDGIGRHGERLYPAFPYTSYTLLSDDDVLAIKAYLFSLKPVHSQTPANEMLVPVDLRPLMGIWSLLFSPDRRFQPVPARGPEWNRGAYLVEAAGHCGECHTPRNLFLALDNRKKFVGTLVAGWKAYNITQDKPTGIGAWSDDELSRYLATGHARGRGAASGPMGEAVDMGLSHMADADIHAMTAYLRSIPPIAADALPADLAPPAPASARLGPTDNPRGKRIFESACVSCHKWDGSGTLTDNATLTGGRAVNDPDPVNIVQTILHGARQKTATGEVFMPPFGSAYTDDEIADVTNYMTSRFGSAPSHFKAEDVRRLRALD